MQRGWRAVENQHRDNVVPDEVSNEKLEDAGWTTSDAVLASNAVCFRWNITSVLGKRGGRASLSGCFP